MSLSGSPEILQDLKQSLVDMSQAHLSWQQDIEDALERCGVNVKLSSEGRQLALMAFSNLVCCIEDFKKMTACLRPIYVPGIRDWVTTVEPFNLCKDLLIHRKSPLTRS